MPGSSSDFTSSFKSNSNQFLPYYHSDVLWMWRAVGFIKSASVWIKLVYHFIHAYKFGRNNELKKDIMY